TREPARTEQLHQTQESTQRVFPRALHPHHHPGRVQEPSGSVNRVPPQNEPLLLPRRDERAAAIRPLWLKQIRDTPSQCIEPTRARRVRNPETIMSLVQILTRKR